MRRLFSFQAALRPLDRFFLLFCRFTESIKLWTIFLRCGMRANERQATTKVRQRNQLPMAGDRVARDVALESASPHENNGRAFGFSRGGSGCVWLHVARDFLGGANSSCLRGKH